MGVISVHPNGKVYVCIDLNFIYLNAYHLHKSEYKHGMVFIFLK